MEREIITFGDYFENFLQTLNEKETKKLDYLLSLLSSERVLSKKVVKYVRDEIYELRMLHNGNIYRVFFIFDDDSIVVLFNGFKRKPKKHQKKK